MLKCGLAKCPINQSEHGGGRPHARLVKTLFHLDVRILHMQNIGIHGSSEAISFQPILQKFLSSRCTSITSFHPARPFISFAAGVRNIQGLLLSHDFSNVPGKSLPCLTRTTRKDNDVRMRALKDLWHFVCIPLREIVLEASSICQQQLSLMWTIIATSELSESTGILA